MLKTWNENYNHLCPSWVRSSCENARRGSLFWHLMCIRLSLRTKGPDHFFHAVHWDKVCEKSKNKLIFRPHIDILKREGDEIKGAVIVPLIPVFQTVFVYLRPVTILLLTWNVNFRWYLLPSFRTNHGLLGFPSSGIGRTISALPGDLISRLKIFTSGSSDSTF